MEPMKKTLKTAAHCSEPGSFKLGWPWGPAGLPQPTEEESVDGITVELVSGWNCSRSEGEEVLLRNTAVTSTFSQAGLQLREAAPCCEDLKLGKIFFGLVADISHRWAAFISSLGSVMSLWTSGDPSEPFDLRLVSWWPNRVRKR